MSAATLQLHPSARCNLRCHHCYSSSGPDRTDALDPALLEAAIDDAAALGYGRLAVSGGEPLMYPHLARLLRRGKEVGMRTLVTTNGTLANRPRLEGIAPWLDQLAFSMDGPPALHNEVRGVPWAFDRLVTGLAAAGQLGIPHGLLYTVTASSWPHMAWGADFARDHGCALFQVHPIQGIGRARLEMDGELLELDLLDAAYVAATRVRQAHAAAMTVHLDLVHRVQLEAMDPAPPRPSVLVVQEDGTVVPYAHGFPAAARIVDLHDERLSEGYDRFARTQLPQLLGIAQHTRQRLLDGDRWVFDWYAELVADAGALLTRAVPVALAGVGDRRGAALG